MIENFDNNNFVYEYLFLNNKAVMLIIDTSNFNIIDANESAEKFFKLNKIDLINNKLSDFSEKNTDKFRSCLESCRDGVIHNFKTSIKIGISNYNIDCTSTLINMDNDRLIHLIINDITIIKEKEDELSKKVSILNQIINTLPQGIFWKNLDCKYQGFNKVFMELVNLNENQILNKDDFDIPPCKDQAFDYINEDKKIILNKVGKLKLLRNLNVNNLDRIFEISKLPLMDEEENVIGVLGVMEDITEKKKSEDALNLSQKMTRAILDHTFEFIGMLDLDGRLIDANLSSIQFTGLPKEQIIGKMFWDTPWWNYSEKSIYLIKNAINRALMGESVSFEAIHYNYRNEEHFFDFSIKPIFDNIGNIIFLIPEGHDITQKKKALELLKESELYYKTLFESANDAIFLMNPRSFIDFNKKVLEMFECTHDDISGKSPLDFSPTIQFDGRPSSESSEEKIKAVLEGKPQFFEWLHRKMNGQLFHAEVSLNRIERKGQFEIQAIVRDISERKKFEKELFEREEDFKNLFELSPFPLMITDIDGNFMNVNESFCDHVGLLKADIIGKKSKDFGIIIDSKSNDLIINRLMKVGEVKNFEFSLNIKGKMRNLLLYSKRVQHNNQSAVITATIDITERKLIEQELTEYKNHLEVLVKNRTQQLEEVNKELEAFSYSVSHDLRAPLRSIDGFSSAILEDYYDRLDDDGKDYLLRIRRAAKSMGQLIDSLLSLARLSKSEMIYEDVNLSNISKQILIRLSQSDIDRNKKFIIKENLIIKADLQLMEILFTNLLENAWKFTKNKLISIIEIGKKVINDIEYFYVKDNGAGFDMSYQNKLFKPFQRLHSTEEFEGTGIGLATVKRIVNRHKGTIWVESIINEGTTFYFSLQEKGD